MPSARLTGQQDAAMQHKPKRFKQEGVELQPGHSCQSYTAPLDLRSQQEMPGTSHEAVATGGQNKAEQVKTEEASRNYTYQFYNVPSEQQERRCISDLSDSSSDEVSLMKPPVHQAANGHHPVPAVKQEASSHKMIYAGWETLPGQRHKPWHQDSPSDEIMKTKTPIYRTTAARSRHERMVQEESLAEGHQSQGTPYTGKQTLTQVLQQLGTQRHLRGLYKEFPGSFELPEELSQDQYRAQRKEDSTFKRRNQFCKGETSYKRDLPLAAKVPAGCIKKSELAATYLLRNVYFSAKEMMPNSSTEALNELCLSQGVGDMVDQLSMYQRSRSIEELQQAIARVVDEGILKRARSCNCFSVLVDQSEDCLAEPCLFLYLRITEQVAGGYEPKTYLLAVKEVGGEEGVTADRITGALREVLEEKDLDVKLLCGLAIDGTAVSAECRSRVVAELRVQSPGLLSVHCVAHRLALSCVSAADTVPYLVKYQHLLDWLYTLLARSSQGWDGLDAVRKVLGGRDTDILPCRWLTVADSVEAIIRNFGTLIPLLRDGRSARSAMLAKAMCTYKFLHCSHFLADVLHQMSILGKSYQSQDDVDFSIVHPLLKSTVTTIDKLGGGGDAAGEMLKNLVATLPTGADGDADGSFTFQGQAIRSGPRQRAEAEATCAAFLHNLSRDLRARFAEPRDADTITALTAVLDPMHASDSKSRHVQTLTDYLSTSLGGGGQGDKERFEMSCKQELISFMNFVEWRPGLQPLANTKDVCRLALKQRLMFPLVGSLAERFLTLPVATAGLGATFHRQHMLRNRLGHSLSASSLENLLKIAMHGPPITEFNFAATCHQLAVHQG
ncbi:zinc finger protein 862-like [Leucoraja erinacea]|uniref:zinc finger protein 862-like n=1 Tax=Leucoraja erinaceus TaxID=7782 RepID=UPI0024582248|nr:zinc finger protein 862-like [Leucoraja erinacea]